MEDIALRLLHDGTDQNARDLFDNWTPLAIACYEGHVEIVKILLEASADSESIDTEGSRPIHR